MLAASSGCFFFFLVFLSLSIFFFFFFVQPKIANKNGLLSWKSFNISNKHDAFCDHDDDDDDGGGRLADDVMNG